MTTTGAGNAGPAAAAHGAPGSAPPLGPQELAASLGLPPPTDEQAAVITAPLAPALVVAGAGSGKTETMAARVVYLVANGLVRPDEVLGLTFTRRAAAELSGRIRRRLRGLAGAGILDPERAAAIGDGEPVIGTYHSFAGRLITEFGPLGGIQPPTRVLSATGCWQLARGIVGRWDRDLDTDAGPERVTQDVLAIAGALADHLADPASLAAALDRLLAALNSAPPGGRQRGPVHSGLVDPLRQLAQRRAVIPLVQAYDEAKRTAGAVDFADQMQLAAALVLASDAIGAALRQRHRVVLLDEYQDTGHAQRVILRALFGRRTDGRGAHPVTAVGDPVQSIYEWRGASASNLPRFATDFPRTDGSPAPVLPLLTSFRNAARVLALANTISAPVRSTGVPVGELRPRPGAPDGAVHCAVLRTVDDETCWLADTIAGLWRAAERPPSTAVLLRRRADMPAVAAALRERGLPVEVVGVGGLVDEPEVADLIAMLRLVVDHQAGPAAVRILTGARWRLGAADLAVLARRGRELQAGPGRSGGREPGPHGLDGMRAPAAPGRDSGAAARLRTALAEAVGGEDVDVAGLVDAIADPGPADRYSPAGYRRITALGRELRRLRSRLSLPLVDLIAELERSTGLDVEVLLTPDGRAHLDAFAEVVADIAAAGAGPVELLDHLATAAEREDGLAPGAVQPVPGRIQVLTVHGAKGLEWDVVAIPHLSARVFPGERTSSWLGDPGRLPPDVRGDRDDLPDLVLPPGADQGELAAALKRHVGQLGVAQQVEERRLFYVALTRARHTLLLSAHHWGASGARPRGPGSFLTELAGHPAIGEPAAWEDPPADGERNPMTAEPRTALWPVDPLLGRREAVQVGADLVRAAVRRLQESAAGRAPAAAEDGWSEPAPPAGPVEDPGDGPPAAAGDGPPATATAPGEAEAGGAGDPHGWFRDVDLLLAERAAAGREPVLDARLPATVSVSNLVDLAADPQRLARRLRRPVPLPPAPQARRGTAFHAWLERHFAGDPLLDIADLPGTDDRDAAPDARLPELVDAFCHSAWADRTPVAVEVPFVTRIGGLTVRGRIDAVFADPDGGATVVDWKTGTPPSGAQADAVAVQLAAYRLAWSRLSGLPLSLVRAAFHYVPADRTVNPADLLDAVGLEELVLAATVADPGGPDPADSG
jgi:DNA helicase-2/ATP-dependent DNA helicase PcrA